MTHRTTNDRTAIVLGGGGVAGIAWELGLLDGLLGAGVPLEDADLVIGTSAGSVVGSLLRFGLVEDSYRQQLGTDTSSYAQPADTDWERMGVAFLQATEGASNEQEARAGIGTIARQVTGGQSEAERIGTFASYFPAGAWPDGELGVCTVDATDGSFRVVTADDGVPLPVAVAASCCVPLVWAPVTIDGRPYVDGGARSVTNADVAEGYDRVLVIACREELDTSPTGPTLPQAVAELRGAGSAVHVMVADADSQAAYGTDVLAVSTREPSARAGRAQGTRIAAEVGAFWAGA